MPDSSYFVTANRLVTVPNPIHLGGERKIQQRAEAIVLKTTGHVGAHFAVHRRVVIAKLRVGIICPKGTKIAVREHGGQSETHPAANYPEVLYVGSIGKFLQRPAVRRLALPFARVQ